MSGTNGRKRSNTIRLWRKSGVKAYIMEMFVIKWMYLLNRVEVEEMEGVGFGEKAGCGFAVGVFFDAIRGVFPAWYC